MGKRLDSAEEWMCKFQIKTLVITVVIVLISALFLASCVTVQNRAYPEIVVDWVEANSYQVVTEHGRGSAWWYDDTHLMTACHVVSRGDTAIVQDKDLIHVLPVKVIACDKDLDLAILEYSEAEKMQLLPTIISDELPRVGDIIYGGGYPFGWQLSISDGHWQQKDRTGSNRYRTSILNVPGDSGSAALVIRDGRVVVVAIRAGGAIVPFYGGARDIITHLSYAVVGLNKFIKDNGR